MPSETLWTVVHFLINIRHSILHQNRKCTHTHTHTHTHTPTNTPSIIISIIYPGLFQSVTRDTVGYVYYIFIYIYIKVHFNRNRLLSKVENHSTITKIFFYYRWQNFEIFGRKKNAFISTRLDLYDQLSELMALLGYFFVFLYFIKESKHVTIFTSKYSDKLKKSRDKLKYLQIIVMIRKRQKCM